MTKQKKALDRSSRLLITFLVLFASIVIIITLYFTTGFINTSNTVFVTNDVETTLIDKDGDSHPLSVTLYFEVDSSKADRYDKESIQTQLENNLSNVPYDEFENSEDPVGVIKQAATDTLLEINPNAAQDIEGVYVSDIQTGQRRIVSDDAASKRQSSVMRGLFKNMN